MKAVHKILVPGDGQQLSVSLACDKDIDVFFFFGKGQFACCPAGLKSSVTLTDMNEDCVGIPAVGLYKPYILF